MNPLKQLTFLLLAVLLVSSCTEEELKTDGQLIGEQIQQLMDEQNIHSIKTYYTRIIDGYSTKYVDEDATTNFRFDGPVVRVGETYYNLDKLTKYQIIDWNEKRIIALYFQVE
ncbi:hypothetical protein [Maribellus sediminis]|uniref:hypothetical protein n=1 Tax=Maribellus sediminis TaxID=2696285 RepID=UPI0014314308|nr:hypothetical protein [Maribellus sediminis]